MPRTLIWLTCALLLSAAGPAIADTSRADPFAAGAQEFLPVEQAYRLQVTVLEGRPLLHWEIAEGYYLYRHRFEFRLQEHPDWRAAAELPAGHTQEDPYFGRVETYYDALDVELAALPGPGVLAITYQGCADGGLCYPPRTEYYQVDPASGEATPARAPADAAGPGSVPQPASPSAPQPDPQSTPQPRALWAMALLAVAGGLILNLMPCVFPVLSLKVLAFARDRDHATAGHGLSYSAGVLASFAAVALLLVVLTGAGRAVGWGFQLQSPLLVGALAYLFLALGLSLSGFWELGGRWLGLGQQLTQRGGYTGSFFTGVLAVVVASPCTAPFMGTALGFAATQPPLPALVVFLALGLGMALPVLLLCLFPGWLQHLPRPGPWMERGKQLLAFPLYATAVWLAWVVGRQAGVNAMAALLGGALLLALALWLWRFGLVARSFAAAALALALTVLASPLMEGTPAPSAPTAAQTYSAERLSSLRAAGSPVFVNVTADWCLSCLANERVALSSERVQRAFASRDVAYLKADWTRYDPAITRLLERYGRNGVPLYLYFPPGGEAHILPQLLTPGRVVEALRDT